MLFVAHPMLCHYVFSVNQQTLNNNDLNLRLMNDFNVKKITFYIDLYFGNIVTIVSTKCKLHFIMMIKILKN